MRPCDSLPLHLALANQVTISLANGMAHCPPPPRRYTLSVIAHTQYLGNNASDDVEDQRGGKSVCNCSRIISRYTS